MLAVPFASNCAAPMPAPLSRKVTVPPGVEEDCEETVAVRVIVWPAAPWVGLAVNCVEVELSEEDPDQENTVMENGGSW